MVKLFTPNWSPAFDLPADGSVQVVDCGDVPTTRPGRVWFEQAILPGLMRKHGIDVWLGTNNTLPLRLPCPAALIVQSLQFFTHPEAFTKPRRWYLRTAVPASIRRADAVVTLSNASSTEIRDRFQIPEPKIRMIPHCLHDVFSGAVRGGSDEEVVQRVSGATAPYILYLSALYPYKNHARLIEAFSRLASRYPRHRLLIGGADTKTWGRRDLGAVAERCGVASQVILAGRIAQEDIAALYRRAELLAMPSLDETFGLPVLEAMSFGCPVLTSNISSMAEVAGDAAVLVNPFSVDELADGLSRLLTSPELRATLSRRGLVQAERFSRDEMMAKFGSVLNSLLMKSAA
jgi:glycosyltransferase involved in cell wall biosynthesis